MQPHFGDPEIRTGKPLRVKPPRERMIARSFAEVPRLRSFDIALSLSGGHDAHIDRTNGNEDAK